MFLTHPEQEAVSRIVAELPSEIISSFEKTESLAVSQVINLGIALAFAGEGELACNRFVQALAMEPSSVAAASGILALSGGSSAQLKCAMSALRLLGTGRDWRRYSRELARAGRTSEAIGAFETALEIYPDRSDWVEELAFLLWGCFRGKEAVKRLIGLGNARHLSFALEWAFQDALDATLDMPNAGHDEAFEIWDRMMEIPVDNQETARQQSLLMAEPGFSGVWRNNSCTITAPSGNKEVSSPEQTSSGAPDREYYRLVPNSIGQENWSGANADQIDRALRIHQLRDVEILSGEWVVLMPDGTATADSCVSFLPLEKREYLMRMCLGWLTITRSGKTVHTGEKAVLVGYVSNYYHWMIDFLPRLMGVLTCPELADRKIVVSSKLEAYAFELFGKLGVPSERLLTVDYPTMLAVPDLAVVDFEERPRVASGAPVFYGGMQPLPVIAALRQRLFRLYGDKPGTGGHRRLFISRRDSTSPRVLNEKAIFEKLAPLGFEAVCLSGMSIAEQIKLFAHAEVVVGAHGAGLTNTLFVPAGTTIIELHDQHRYMDFFERIAAAVGAAHRSVASSRTYISDAGRLQNQYEVDPDFVLQEILSVLSL